ncbi:hypothetical protein GUJ93_ZPchr0010g10695 [Zizania palustris]|uniref:Uncharacterized protein n=1 Tax=Zizania palustris TaxID=103762 RepID=A0A8J5WHN6_ZIZPA|nr:hypothetical protein GUJ93_ZPchr0010g10695 [Zizania palustris]
MRCRSPSAPASRAPYVAAPELPPQVVPLYCCPSSLENSSPPLERPAPPSLEPRYVGYAPVPLPPKLSELALMHIASLPPKCSGAYAPETPA